MSSGSRQPTEEELRAAYEAELKRLRVEHVLLDNVVALVNLGMRRTGLVPGTEDERDPGQVRLAIESIRALLPVLEQAAPAQVGAIRDAVSQLQLAFVKIGGQPGPGGGPETAAPAGERAGPGAETVPAAPPALSPGRPQPGRSPVSPRHRSRASPGRRSAAGGSGCRASNHVRAPTVISRPAPGTACAKLPSVVIPAGPLSFRRADAALPAAG